MSFHPTKILHLHRQRDHADAVETADATAYFRGITADLAAHADEPLGADVDQDEPDADPQPRPRPPRRPGGWTEEDARALVVAEVDFAAAREPVRREVLDAYGFPRDAFAPKPDPVDEDQADEHLPEPRRLHLPAVGAWLADRLKPIPLPAIPDADRYRVEPMPVSAPEESGRLALEAAASTEQFAGERPEDFGEWLRLELGATYAKCEAAIADNARTAATHLHHLTTGFFLGAQHTFDEMNAMTLPGWTAAETAIYNTGVFAS